MPESPGGYEKSAGPPYYADEFVTLHNGDAETVLRSLPNNIADCVVTSPPYFGLRDYGTAGQIGVEDSPAEYVEAIRRVFAALVPVLKPDGTVWLNLGDSYYSGKGNPGPNSADAKQPARRGWVRPLDRPGQEWARPKNLLGIPWRVAFALQDDGWTLRNAIVWHKPNALPESVQDRLSGRYELVFLLTSSRSYHFDLDAIREPHAASTVAAAARARIPYAAPGQKPQAKTRGMAVGGANPGDVWAINTRPYPEAHFATFPIDLPTRCIKAGCRPGGVVLDPFSGSGTTGVAARALGRQYVGIDLNTSYLDLAIKRFAQGVLGFDYDAPQESPGAEGEPDVA